MKADKDNNLSGWNRQVRNIRFAISTSWNASQWLFIGNIFLYVVQGLMPILIAFIAGSLINSIVTYLSGDLVSTQPIYLLLVAAVVVQFLFNQSFRANQYLEEKLDLLVSRRLTSDLQVKFAELDHSYYEDSEFNKHLNKVVQNFHPINTYSMRLFRVLSSLVQLIASAIAIVTLHFALAIIIALAIIPVLRVEMRASKERWKVWDRVDADWRLRWDINWDILSLRSITEIKMFQVFKYLSSLWRRYFDKTTAVRLEVERRAQIRQFWASLLESVTQLGINIWLLMRVLSRQGFGIGDFEFYRRIVSDFSTAASRLVVGLQDISEGGLYVSDYLDLMATKPRILNQSTAIALNSDKLPSIEFKNVSFKYPGSNEFVLNDLNLTIQPGDDVALVGANGAGKTTLIKLLMRFYDPTEGEILIDGTNLRDLDLDTWHAQVGVLFQDFNRYPYLRVKRIIGMGDVSKLKDMPAIEHAAKEAGAHDFITQLKDGYDTVLTKSYRDGVDLSGGQWQKIALARAFLRNANILILDEPTSAIDAKAEYEIFKRINETQKDKTTIIISHRFSTVRNADKIYVIDEGKIIESGSHEQLMKNQGMYHELFESQAQGYR